MATHHTCVITVFKHITHEVHVTVFASFSQHGPGKAYKCDRFLRYLSTETLNCVKDQV